MSIIKTGDYFLFAHDLQNRPIGPKSLEDIHEVVVQYRGTQAHKWRIEHVEGDKYFIRFGSYTAVKQDGRLVLVPILPGPEPPSILWNIVPENRAPPSPEPLYGIFVPDVAHQAWFAPKVDPFAQVPVTIFEEALAVSFYRVE